MRSEAAAHKHSASGAKPRDPDPAGPEIPGGRKRTSITITTTAIPESALSSASPSPSSSASPSPTETNPDADLESSRPSSRAGTGKNPDVPPAHTSSPRLSRNRINHLRLAALCLVQLTSGLTDSATGTLIPAIEHGTHLQTSLLFVGQALGFILGAAFVDPISSLLDSSHSPLFLLANSLVAAAYVPFLLSSKDPAPSFFITVVLGFFLLGFGNSFNLSLGNVFAASGPRLGTSNSLGLMHGAYGLGGALGPLIANTVVSVEGLDSWGKYYWITFGLALLGTAGTGSSFWGYHGMQGQGKKSAIKVRTEHWQASLAAIDWRVVLLGALFVFAYQGAEVSISGWAFTFLKEERNAGDKFGYATAGYWAGIAIGRFLLTPLGERFGEKRFVYFVVALCAAFQIVVWFVRNPIADSVVFAVIGLLLGPVYPCAVAVFMRNMREQERTSGIGIISAFGSSGGAVAPFITGAIADSCGSWVLNPIAVVLFGAMLVCWYFSPDDPTE
ncbi:bypass of stop codon protein 6 [Cladorrhinum samala]|uniref:Bypass of stop codon protein 6 n=1 Tax=Cladorrhinum samala TaxID=585594 RepID=A0AAV9HW03_9PEZI|nr:bypass of stop codon protein 6 [Cladorrhinum samala]